jgi:DNA polymerase I
LLTDLRSFRLEAKGQMQLADKEGNRPRWHHLHALQNTFKILINSFYGYLGFAQGHFADFDAAARVTQIGRDLLQQMIAWLQEHGAQVIEVDTDGIYFVPPTSSPDSSVEAGVSPAKRRRNAADTAATTAKQMEEIAGRPPRSPVQAGGQVARPTIGALREGLAEILPPGIEVEFDEQFDAMFSYKAKNYALLTRSGDVIIKGGALKSRGLEKFQRVFLEEMIKLIMQGKPVQIGRLRDQFEKQIRNRELPIEMLMKSDTLQDSLEKYRVKIAGSARNRAAAYELALASGRNYKPGDQISYYVKATPKKVAAYEAAKLASEFDPQNRDENSDYYVAKLNELVKKFSGITAEATSAKQESLPF